MSDDLIDKLINRNADAVRIEELVEERDAWKARYESHLRERLAALELNIKQIEKIRSLMAEILNLKEAK
jgi:hypothetical protein